MRPTGAPTKKKGEKTKRTRRGGRGRARRRGAAAAAQLAAAFEEYYSQFPWWYAHMAQSGLIPEGFVPTAEDGYPVILPSRQAVYILPNAVNPHRAATYVPKTQADDAQSEAPSEDFAPCVDEDASIPDILNLARSQSMSLKGELTEPALRVSFSFLDIEADDDCHSVVSDDSSSSDTFSISSSSTSSVGGSSFSSTSTWE